MPIPTTITPAANQVVFEIEDSVNEITSRTTTDGFGTIVLIGTSVTLYAVAEIVFGKECSFFQENTFRYGITDEANIKFTYIPV